MTKPAAETTLYAPDSPAAHYWYARAVTAPWLPLMPLVFVVGALVGIAIGAAP